MAPSLAHPVQTLREHATNFEAALSVCLAEPKPRAVHKLRTESRRLEAQIALLSELRGLPPYRKLAEKVLRLLAKFRRAAGAVRDLDVQTDALKEYSEKQAQARSHTGTETEIPVEDIKETAAKREDDIEEMIATREKRRAEAVSDLINLIEERQAKVSRALEKLLAALKDAENLSLNTSELVRIADHRFRGAHAKTNDCSTETLHAIRKAAKQARYVAETADAPAAAAVAQRYEQLQEAGGKWHDWLDLTDLARQELGRKHPVAKDFVQFRDTNLTSYKSLLEQFQSSNGHGKRKKRSQDQQSSQHSSTVRSAKKSAKKHSLKPSTEQPAR